VRESTEARRDRGRAAMSRRSAYRTEGRMMTKRSFLTGGLAAIGAGAAGRLLSGGSNADAAATFPVSKTDEEWRRSLTPEQYRVLRQHGTERAGSSPLNKEHRAGTFVCAGCAQPLFSSETKFVSGTGWPIFWAPIDGAVGTLEDRSFFMTPTEVHSNRY